MAKLTYKQREKLEKKPKNFALPGEKKYPVVDASGKLSWNHAQNAKARATQEYKKGNLSLNEKERIDRKADKVMKETKPPRGRFSGMKKETEKKRMTREEERDNKKEKRRKEEKRDHRRERQKESDGSKHVMDHHDHLKEAMHHMTQARKKMR